LFIWCTVESRSKAISRNKDEPTKFIIYETNSIYSLIKIKYKFILLIRFIVINKVYYRSIIIRESIKYHSYEYEILTYV